MAEFLIYDQVNWMDKPSKERPDLIGYENVKRKIHMKQLSIENKTMALVNIDRKYNARYVSDNISEVRHDGTGMTNMEKFSFKLVCAPSIPFVNVNGLGNNKEDSNERVLKRASYSLNTAGLTFDKDKTVVIDEAIFNSRLVEN